MALEEAGLVDGFGVPEGPAAFGDCLLGLTGESVGASPGPLRIDNNRLSQEGCLVPVVELLFTRESPCKYFSKLRLGATNGRHPQFHPE